MTAVLRKSKLPNPLIDGLTDGEKWMDLQPKESLVMDAQLAKEPEISRWLWALQNTRLRTMRELEGVRPLMIDWSPGDDESSIGTILYHMADIEADWLYVEALGLEVPPQLMADLFPHPTRDAQGRLTQVLGFSLEQHLSRLATVRNLVLAAYQSMELSEFRRVRSFRYYDVTAEYVLHHLMQHEAEHRSQLGALRTRAERALVA
jgi:uncharacterized damage-inducible protein DinB